MRTGEVLSDRFELGARAGAGAMGTVFRAVDRETGRTVAVKVLRAPSEVSVRRFEREAEILRRLDHPAIVGFVAQGKTPGDDHYIALDWVDGETLSARLKRGALTLDESIALAKRVAGALYAAHEKSVIHRDIKPGNLALDHDDPRAVKVLDFGIARLMEAATLTVSGGSLGTPGYMAPEQARDASDIDARTDVYSLGCVLFHAIAGRPPYVADSMLALLLQSVVEDAPRLSQLVPSVPAELDQLLARMLARTRDERPATARDVERALDAIGSPRRPSKTVVAHDEDTLTTRERRAACVLVARGARLVESPDGLRAVAARFDATSHLLVDGTVVLSFSGRAGAAESSVVDVARRAGRAALSLAAAFEGTHVVVVTARTASQVAGPSAEALHGAIVTAAAVLTASVEHAPAIRVDELTAGLLDPTCVLEQSGVELAGAAAILTSERDVADAGRPVLGRPTPCVGRELELSLLEADIRTAFQERRARSAWVLGEAGAGKSRVRHELLRRLGELAGGELWIGRIDSMSSGVPFALLANMLRRAAGITDDVGPSQRVGKLAAFVAERVDPADRTRVTAFVAELAGIPLPDVAAPELRAARQSSVLMFDHLRRAWVDLVRGQCRRGPLLLVLEDLHWSDPPSLRFTESALEQASDSPVFVLALARPEVETIFPHALAAAGRTEIRLGPLSATACAELARAVLPQRLLSAAVEADLAQRSAGNAFYLEELLRAVAHGKNALPETAVAMAESRLEELPAEVRRALRAASIFGQTFWSGGLDALLGAGSGSGRAFIDEFVQRELCVRHRTSRFANQSELAFRHALLREAAYATLTDEDRVRGHRLVARWLERMPEADARLVAEHFDRGDEKKRAARWYGRAAELALDANELESALDLAGRGIERGAQAELLGRLRLVEAEAYDWRGEYAMERERGDIAMAHLAPGSEDWARAAYCVVRAGTILRDIDRTVVVTEELLGFAQQHAVVPSNAAYGLLSIAHRVLYIGQYDLSARIVGELATGGRLDEGDLRVMAMLHVARAARAGFEGDYGDNYLQYRKAVELAEAVGDLRTASIARVNSSFSASRLGMYGEAEGILRAALAPAEHLGMGRVITAVHNNLAHALEGLGRHREAQAEARLAVAMASSQQDIRLTGGSRIYLARALSSTGDHAAAEREACRAAEELETTRPLLPQALGMVSRAALARDRPRVALAASSRAMEVIAELGLVEEGEAVARLAHVEALFACDRPDDARAALRVAHERLLERASKLQDAELCVSFLQNVKENARTLELAEQHGVV